MDFQQKWQALVAPILANTPYEWVGVAQEGGKGHKVIRLYIDKEGGITIDDIAKITRKVSVLVDVEAPVIGPFTLEVSSPGLDRPLFCADHYKQQVGQQIALKSRMMVENRQNYKGKLVKATDEGIDMEVAGKIIAFLYDDIEKAKVIPTITIGRGKEEAK